MGPTTKKTLRYFSIWTVFSKMMKTGERRMLMWILVLTWIQLGLEMMMKMILKNKTILKSLHLQRKRISTTKIHDWKNLFLTHFLLTRETIEPMVMIMIMNMEIMVTTVITEIMVTTQIMEHMENTVMITEITT